MRLSLNMYKVYLLFYTAILNVMKLNMKKILKNSVINYKINIFPVNSF